MGNRPAAVLHHLNSPIRYFGNGPYSTFDPNTKKYKFGGDASHLLNVYADIGIIGLVLSYCMLIAKLKGREVNLYLLGCISTLFIFSSTVNILTDGSIMLAFNIFINSSLVRPLAIKQINS